MGKQSSRLIYRGKDIKDLYYRGKRLFKLYKGNQLVWEKLIGDEYLVLGNGSYLIILDMDEKEAYTCIGRDYASSGKEIYVIGNYADYTNALFVTGDGINYTYLSDVKGAVLDTYTKYYASTNGFYISYIAEKLATYSRYRVHSYLKNESGQVIKNEDFFDSSDLRRFIPLNNVINYKSDIIPFGYDSINGVYYFAKGDEVVTNGFIHLYNEYATEARAVAFICIENTLHIIHTSYHDGSSCYDVTHFNLNENKCWKNSDVFRIYSSDLYFKKVVYQYGKLYLYFYLDQNTSEMKRGLYCYESSDFANFKRTECDGENYYRGLSYPYYSGIGDVFYLGNDKISKKDCMIMFTTTGPLYIDNMYFNKTDGCFAFSIR